MSLCFAVQWWNSRIQSLAQVPQHGEGATRQISLWEREEGDGPRKIVRGQMSQGCLEPKWDIMGKTSGRQDKEHRGKAGKQEAGDEKGCDPHFHFIETKRAQWDLSMAHGDRDLIVKCKCLHWREAMKRRYHESLFQSVSYLCLIKAGTNLPCFLLSLPFLIQTKAITVAPVAIAKSLPIHETGLQQGHGITVL